jgi:hypothetical protein
LAALWTDMCSTTKASVFNIFSSALLSPFFNNWRSISALLLGQRPWDHLWFLH